MNRHVLAGAASLLALCACGGRAHVAPPPSIASAGFVPAVRLEERPAPPAGPAVMPLPASEEPPLGEPDAPARERGAPTARVDSANRAAVREPSRHGYVNARQVYAWTEGALYRLYSAPEQVSEIALQAGETLISVAAGDTVRWVIGDTASGSGAARRTHILVKPTDAGLRTNLVITTDRRVYHLQLESTARTAMASISWIYPRDELIAVAKAREVAEPAAVAEGVSLDSLNFDYGIEGDEPGWRPLRAFDDGQQVFIEFPAGLALGEAPPLFVVGRGGRSELVNYRVRGRYYVVDRLFDAAELRLGERRQEVVRIVRGQAGERRRRGRSS